MTALSFAAAAAFPQEVTIRVRGAAVLAIQPPAPPEEEAPIPDLGGLLSRAAGAGLFGGAASPPWAAVAEVRASEVVPAERRATWRLRLDGIDPGAVRIIWNLLRALDLDEASMVAEPLPDGRPIEVAEVARLAYPDVHRPLPFALDVVPPAHSSRNRLVQVVFQRPPPESAVDAALDACGLWTQLLLLGGYPEDGGEPHESAAFPDPPFQLDEVTVEQAFPDLFAADEKAFHAVAAHGAGHEIACVVAR
jgi:hypothetical protein